MGGVCVLAPNPNGEAESLPSSRSKQFEDISGHSVPALHPSVYEHAARLADKRSQVSPHYLIMGQHGIFRTPGSAETRFPLSIRPETSLCLGPYIKADKCPCSAATIPMPGDAALLVGPPRLSDPESRPAAKSSPKAQRSRHQGYRRLRGVHPLHLHYVNSTADHYIKPVTC